MMTSSRICVVMGDDRPVVTGVNSKASYSSLAYEINRRFCDKKGWDFRYEKYALPKRPWGVWQGYSRQVSEHRAPTWIKILAVHKTLKLGYDFVVWIDSDCIFYDHDRSWDEVFAEFNHQGLQLIGWLDKPFHSNKFCAGFFIVRNSKEVKNMLETIWLKDSKFSWAFPYEQHELNSYLSESPATNYLFLDEPMFQLTSLDQFLLHVAGFEHQNRVPTFLKWFDDHSYPPYPLKIEEHVFQNLKVDDYDRMLSNSELSVYQRFQREFWGLLQHGRQKLKKIYHQFI
ncbi:hypothetical protein N9N85_01910 [Schleiferiaceae bacterium]|nr:hypothetical protein [Schleiferiaceae bacterium]